MPYLAAKILLMLFLLSLSAFFSCSETAIFSLTRAEIKFFKESSKKYARVVIGLLQRPRDTLITILFGNELVNVAIAVVVASVVYDFKGPVGWKVSTLISICIATPLILVFGEIVPKNIAIRYSKVLTPALVLPLNLFYRLTLPVRFVLTKFSERIVLFFGGDPDQVRSMIMEEEFRQLVELGYKEGILEEGELKLIHRIFEFGDKTASEIMTPVGRIFRISIDSPLEKVVQEVRATQFSRIPVYHKRQGDIAGILHSRDLFRLYRNAQRGHAQDIGEIVRPAHFAAENMSIETLLGDFQKLKVHIAMVVDRKNRVTGLVTMDDIIRLLFARNQEKACGDITSQ